MSVTVRIPTPLRQMTHGKDKVEVTPSTMGELIQQLDAAYPGIRDRLLDEAGEMHYFVNLYLNGEDVRFLQGMDTSTKSGDELSIVPAVAGGSKSPVA